MLNYYQRHLVADVVNIVYDADFCSLDVFNVYYEM